MIYRILFLSIITLLSVSTKAQLSDDGRKIIQFSGVVMSSDSLRAIPYVHIIDRDLRKGTVSNFQGFFSFVAHEGDTVEFSAIGYKDAVFVIPNDLEDDKYSAIQLMTQDTFHLIETIIYPWPSREDFKRAFLALDVPDDDLERARKNLHREKLREMGLAMSNDANDASDFYFKENAKQYYYAGQYPPIQIFNPFAWAKFIEAWKNGDFKRKRKKRI